MAKELKIDLKTLLVWMCLGGFFENITRNIPEDRQEEVLEAVRVFTEAMKKAAVECRCCES